MVPKEQLKNDLQKVCVILCISGILYLLWDIYGNKVIAKLEATYDKTIFTTKENDCRIDNLKYLNKESNGKGKVYLLKVYNSKQQESHLIVCNSKNQIIDRNLIFVSTECNFNNLEINSTIFPNGKYKRLAELFVSNNNIKKTILYIDSNDKDYDLTLHGIEYTNVFLKSLKR